MKLLPACFWLVVLAASASADIVTMKDGRRLEGEIISEDHSTILLKMPRATALLRRGEIESIVHTESPLQQAENRLKGLPENLLAPHLELAAWCRKQGLEGKAHEILLAALPRWPNDESLRTELGYRRWQGRWVSEKQYYERQGYIEYRGQWIPPENQVEFEGQTMAAAERDRRIEQRRRTAEKRNRYLADGRPWSSAEELRCGKWSLKTNCSPQRAEEIRDMLERFQRSFRNPFLSGKSADRIDVHVFRTRESFLAQTAAEARASAEHVLGFYQPAKKLMVFFDRLDAPLKFATTLRHESIHAQLDLVAGLLPRWIHEGLATYFADAGVPSEELRGRRGFEYRLRLTDSLATQTPATLHDLLNPASFSGTEYAASWGWIDLFMADQECGSGFTRFLKDWTKDNRKSHRTDRSDNPLVRLIQSVAGSQLSRCPAPFLAAQPGPALELAERYRSHHQAWERAELSPLDRMGRALAQAEAAWADLHATGVAAEARALKRISKARQYLVAADSLVAPADSWLQLVELYLARAQVALTARQDPWALEEPVAQLLEQARRWADRSSDQQGETYFEAGEVLHDTVRRLVDLEWQEIELLQGFSTSVAGSTEAWSDLLLHHHQVLDSLPAELDGERLRQRQLARRDPLRRLAHGSAALLRDFAHRHPPAAEAVGDLTYLATAVVPQWLAEASDLAQFLLKVDPSDRAHVWWGQILLSEGDRLRARQMARRATELEPDMPSATRLLEELALPKKEVKKARLLESDSDAIQKFFLDYDRALEAQGTRLRPVAELFFERCKQTLASASQEQGVVQALQRRLDHGQALGPLDADLEKLARRAFQAYYEKSWRSPHVREYCRSILLVDPDHPLAHAVLGRWYARRVLQSKDPENRLLAEEHINAIPGEGTDHLFEVVSSLGFFQHHGAAALGDEDETARAEVWKQAIQYWKRAIALGHTRPYQDWVSIGLAWNELQGTTAAIQAFETAAKLAPSWSTPLVHSAQARVKLGHEGSALEDLFVAFERGERRSSALQLALELIWRRAGWQERAEKLVDDYVGKALLAPNARFALGRVQAWIGRTRDAEKSLGTASYLSRDVKKIEEYARFCEARKSRRTKLAWERLLQVIDDLPAAERRAHKKLRDEAKKRIRELERELRERGS